ncbi:hypothetical protein VTK56DRAFT_9532 [Thermocarpiscus australiensis]
MCCGLFHKSKKSKKYAAPTAAYRPVQHDVRVDGRIDYKEAARFAKAVGSRNPAAVLKEGKHLYDEGRVMYQSTYSHESSPPIMCTRYQLQHGCTHFRWKTSECRKRRRGEPCALEYNYRIIEVTPHRCRDCKRKDRRRSRGVCVVM